MFLAILAILLTLLLVVGIHEGAHALAARCFQVKIKRIAIGFGKPLVRWRSKSGCEWVWAILPLGGYVQLENTRISPVQPYEYSSCFDKKPIWQRILILLAGVLANLLTAWFALILVYHIGLIYLTPQIQTVAPNSVASSAGMVAGEQFVSIGDQGTPTWNDVGMQLVSYWGTREVEVLLVQKDGKNYKKVKLNLSQVHLKGLRVSLLKELGIEPNLSAAHGVLRFPVIGDAIHQANAVLLKILYFFLIIFKQLFSGVIPFSMLLGPLSVFTAAVASLTQGLVVFMWFIATLSLAVALVNLFPVPGLDGGSIIYVLIEKIRGKPVSVAMELLVHRLAFILFCMVLVHLLLNDLQRI